MTDEQLAQRAYSTWDAYGGRALGAWSTPYTKEAWLQVVAGIREAIQDETVSSDQEQPDSFASHAGDTSLP